MGNKHSILVWELCPADSRYYFTEVYGGNSFIKALWYFRSAKSNAYGCVRWDWR